MKTIGENNKKSAKRVGISRKMLCKLSKFGKRSDWEDLRCKRKDALHPDTVQLVVDFFERGDISRALPDARSARVDGETIKPRKVLEMSLQSAFELFLKDHGALLKFSTFKKLKPKHVLPFTSHKFKECLCEYCVNIDLQIKALNIVIPNQITDRYSLNRMTLCSEQKRSCANRECDNCGVDVLDNTLLPSFANVSSTQTTWFK